MSLNSIAKSFRKSRFYQYAALAVTALGLYFLGLVFLPQMLGVFLCVCVSFELCFYLYNDAIITLESVPLMVKDVTSSTQDLRKSCSELSNLSSTFRNDFPKHVDNVSRDVRVAVNTFQHQTTTLGHTLSRSITSVSNLFERNIGRSFNKMAKYKDRVEENYAQPLMHCALYLTVVLGFFMSQSEHLKWLMLPSTTLLVYKFYEKKIEAYMNFRSDLSWLHGTQMIPPLLFLVSSLSSLNSLSSSSSVSQESDNAYLKEQYNMLIKVFSATLLVTLAGFIATCAKSLRHGPVVNRFTPSRSPRMANRLLIEAPEVDSQSDLSSEAIDDLDGAQSQDSIGENPRQPTDDVDRTSDVDDQQVTRGAVRGAKVPRSHSR